MHYRLAPLQMLLCFMMNASIWSAPSVAGWSDFASTAWPTIQVNIFDGDDDGSGKRKASTELQADNQGGEGKTSSSAAAIPAFPGAEGHGAMAVGGRGGRVIEVTNLNDSGPGSLREAIMATGPRMVVFRVGGTIELKSDLIIRGEEHAYLTIAGQTAPGGGILIKKYGIWVMDTHDIVIRYLRIRIGHWGSEGGQHGILIYGYQSAVRDVIFDHCSVSWILDDNSLWGNVSNVTLQWCLMAEASDKGRDGYANDCGNYGGCGLMWGPAAQVNNVTIHHSLLMHNYYRSPALGGIGHQIINNIIYNPGWTSTHMGVTGSDFPISVDFIGNYYKMGPNTRAGIKEISFETNDAKSIQLYLQDNYGWNFNPNDPYSIVASSNYNRRSSALAKGPTSPVTIHTHEQGKDFVLSKVGATLPKRDAVDERLLNEFNTRTGKLGIGSSFPVIANGTPLTDADRDGMADLWEKAHGCNPNNASDGVLDGDSDGYTNIEEYLQELAGDQAAIPTLAASSSALPATGFLPLTVQFSGSATGGAPPYNYYWDFRNGRTSTVQNPSQTFVRAGVYNVTLTVTDSQGKSATATTRIVALENLPPSPPAKFDVAPDGP
jgi:hypothetical protein